MKFQKLIAVICTAAYLSTATASAAGMKYLNASNFKNQIDFLLNRGRADVTYDMNCDNVINAFDLVLMKQIEANEKARYVNNIFENVSVEKDIVFAQKTDYQNNSVDLALDLYHPESDNYEYRPAVILVHGGGMYTGSKDSEWDPVAYIANDLAMKGYVCVSINYRLNPEWEETGAFNETLVRSMKL